MKLNIGFSFNISHGAASLFLNRLNHSIKEQRLANTSYYFNPFVDCNIFANKPKRFFNKPYFFRVDGIAFNIFMEKTIKDKINNYLKEGMLFSSGTIFQSNFSKKLATTLLDLKPENSEIIINGTDLNLFNYRGHNLRKELSIEQDALVFITSAKWRKHKRLNDIINVFNLFRQNFKGICYLLVIGKSDVSIPIDKHIKYFEYIENTKIPELLRTGDIYLFFSWLDNCPNSVIESIACGLPVICTNQGGTKEIIEVTNGGIVVNADDEFEFQEIDLNKPPRPNYDKILDAIFSVQKDLQFYKSQINTSEIDINFIAQKYISFIQKCLNER